jgi:putative endonuclease
MNAFVYMVRCHDGTYYVGSTRASLEQRISQNNEGTFDGYTAQRRPVTLVWSQDFERITDAIAAEQQLKGWSRGKKEALIRGDWELISALASRASPLKARGTRRPSP